MRSPIINVMVKAASKAARGLKRDFGEVEQLQVSKKGPADFVSTADLKAEKVLREELAHARPKFAFLMEEAEGGTSTALGDETTWVVDPLDGTSNFLHGLPHFAISIAVVERGQPIAGVIYDPIKEEMFTAEKGQGAFLNERTRLRVSGRSRLDEALLATGAPFKGHGDGAAFTSELEAVMAETAGIRRWGAAALDLAYVAAGRYDGFWERGLSPWDVAAGAVILREAGGRLSTIEDRPFKLNSDSLLASNAELHTPIAKLLKNAAKAAIEP